MASEYLFWLPGLVFLYPACSLYNGFNRRKPLDSVWRFFSILPKPAPYPLTAAPSNFPWLAAFSTTNVQKM